MTYNQWQGPLSMVCVYSIKLAFRLSPPLWAFVLVRLLHDYYDNVSLKYCILFFHASKTSRHANMLCDMRYFGKLTRL